MQARDYTFVINKYIHYYQSYLFTNECTSDCLKNNIKIYSKTTPTCSGAVTPSTGSSSSVLASNDDELPEDRVIAPKHVGAVLM